MSRIFNKKETAKIVESSYWILLIKFTFRRKKKKKEKFPEKRGEKGIEGRV